MIFNINTKLFFEVNYLEQVLRLILAAILGSVLGFERELKNKPAGFITFMFVSVGACLFALLQINLISMAYQARELDSAIFDFIKSDISRIVAQVVSGIGFLGAGTIIFNKGAVKGITTAAMLWVAAALGLLVGIGGLNNYIIAVTTTVILVPLMLLSRQAGRKLTDRFKVHRVFISFEEPKENELYEYMTQKGATIKKTFFHNKYQVNGIHYKEVYFYFTVNKKTNFDEVVRSLSHLDWILSLEDM